MSQQEFYDRLNKLYDAADTRFHKLYTTEVSKSIFGKYPQYALIHWLEKNRDAIIKGGVIVEPEVKPMPKVKADSLIQPKNIVSENPTISFWVKEMNRTFTINKRADGKVELFERFDGYADEIAIDSIGPFATEKAAIAQLAEICVGFRVTIWKAYNAAVKEREKREAVEAVSRIIGKPFEAAEFINRFLISATVKYNNRTFTFVYDEDAVGREKIILSGRHSREKREHYYGEAVCSREDVFDFVRGAQVAVSRLSYKNYLTNKWEVESPSWYSVSNFVYDTLKNTFVNLKGRFVFNYKGVEVVVVDGKIVEN